MKTVTIIALRSQPEVCDINSVGDSCQTTLLILVSRQRNFSVPPEKFQQSNSQRYFFKADVISCPNSTYQYGFCSVEVG